MYEGPRRSCPHYSAGAGRHLRRRSAPEYWVLSRKGHSLSSPRPSDVGDV
ncbi:hypothetical protein GTW45_07450 [Streptomyces sp. SID4940]|nr:hypothetical protein [Streptomyces sp. SID4940]